MSVPSPPWPPMRTARSVSSVDRVVFYGTGIGGEGRSSGGGSGHFLGGRPLTERPSAIEPWAVFNGGGDGGFPR